MRRRERMKEREGKVKESYGRKVEGRGQGGEARNKLETMGGRRNLEN